MNTVGGLNNKDANSKLKLFAFILHAFLIAGLYIFVNAFSFRGIYQFPKVNPKSDYESALLVLGVLLILVVGGMLTIEKLWGRFAELWKENWPLIIFILYAITSLAWSAFFDATLYKLYFLLVSSLVVSYFALRFGLRGIITIITIMAGFSVVVSLWMLTTPLGIMKNEPFVGSWVGVFWHRNHTGSIFAFFSMFFLMRFLWDVDARVRYRFLFLLLYVLSVLFVLRSRSAAGFIVFCYLHLLILLVSVWLNYHKVLQSKHYIFVGLVLFLGTLVFILNTEYIFGLLGRSATMTGRVPLWHDLLLNVYTEKPLFGYGYGALWMQQDFRHFMQLRHGWKYEVFFADNGFLDILLNTGALGLILFMWFYIKIGFESLNKLMKKKDWVFAVPVITLNYVFIGNIAYSFLLEVDQFVWLLLIVWGFTRQVWSDEKAA